jgi:membrane protein required for colicin V production
MDGSPIQAYDVVMLVVLGLTAVFGAWKGMAWQVASLASLIVSAIVALQFSGPLAPFLSDQEWAPFAAMLILYLVTSLAIWLAFRLVAGAIDRLKLKEFDHQVGALFGLAKGVLLCLVITFFAVTLSEQTRQTVAKTWSGRAARVLIEQGSPLIPNEARAVVGKYLEEFDQKLKDTPAPEAPRTADAPGAKPALPESPPARMEGPASRSGGLRDRSAEPKKAEPDRKSGPPGTLEFPPDFRFPDRT